MRSLSHYEGAKIRISVGTINSSNRNSFKFVRLVTNIRVNNQCFFPDTFIGGYKLFISLTILKRFYIFFGLKRQIMHHIIVRNSLPGEIVFPDV